MMIIPLNVGTWNVHTQLDRDDTDKPQKKTALDGSDLSRYNINIAIWSEIQLAGEGELCKIGTG